MSRLRSCPGAVLAAALLAACGSGTSANPPAPTPAPRPGEPAPPAPTAPGRGPAVTYKPVRDRRLPARAARQPEPAVPRRRRRRSRCATGSPSCTSPWPSTHAGRVQGDDRAGFAPGARERAAGVARLGAAARGTRWTATLSSTGGLGPLTADRQGTLPEELTGRLRLLFPALPAGGVREGMEWTDTTEYRLTADAFPGSERAVTTYHAAASDAPGTRKGITLQSTGSYQRTGTRTQADQELQMSATGTRRQSHSPRPRRHPHLGAGQRRGRHDDHRAHRGPDGAGASSGQLLGDVDPSR